MNVVLFSPEYSVEVKSFVIGVLSGEGFEYDPLKDSDLDGIEEIYHGKGGAFFMCILNNGVAGTSAVKNLGSGVCEIKRLYVKREFRGKGLGLALFLEALAYANKYYLSVRIKTDSSLKKAISLYLKNGFAIVKEESGVIYFEKDLK